MQFPFLPSVHASTHKSPKKGEDTHLCVLQKQDNKLESLLLEYFLPYIHFEECPAAWNQTIQYIFMQLLPSIIFPV